jgi:hypothetical protein
MTLISPGFRNSPKLWQEMGYSIVMRREYDYRSFSRVGAASPAICHPVGAGVERIDSKKINKDLPNWQTEEILPSDTTLWELKGASLWCMIRQHRKP